MDEARWAWLEEQLTWMPWMLADLGPDERAAAHAWQREVQARWGGRPEVSFGEGAIIGPGAVILAEPGRPVRIGAGCAIASQVLVHGPVTLGDRVVVHPRAALDGGRVGLVVGEGTRIAHGATLLAYDHGLDPTTALMDQPLASRGIRVGRDVWVGAGARIADGVRLGDHAVIGMGAVVTADVADWAIVAGAPAQVVGDRRDRH